MMKGLAEGLERSGPPLLSLLATAPAELKIGFERLASFGRPRRLLPPPSQPARERVVAIDVLARGRPDMAEIVVSPLLSPTQPGEIQLAAAKAVARLAGPLWLPKFSATGASCAGHSAGASGGLDQQSHARSTLVPALEQEWITPSELDAAARTMLEHLPDAKLRERATQDSGSDRTSPAFGSFGSLSRRSQARGRPAVVARPSSRRIVRPATSARARGIR